MHSRRRSYPPFPLLLWSRAAEGGRDRPGPVPSVDVTATGAEAGDALGIARRSNPCSCIPDGDKFNMDDAGKALFCRLAGGEDRLVLRSFLQVLFGRPPSRVLRRSRLALRLEVPLGIRDPCVPSPTARVSNGKSIGEQTFVLERN